MKNEMSLLTQIEWPKRFDEKKLQSIYEKQREYLEVKTEGINKKIGQLGIEVYMSYLPMISEIYEPINNCKDNYYPESGIIYFDITKWVRDPEEKSIDKLVNMYETLSDQECTLALIYERNYDKCKVTLAVANAKSEQRTETNELGNRIAGALRGNFPGAVIKESDERHKDCDDKEWTGYGIPDSLVYKEGSISVAAISNIPSEKSEDYISQSMEKLLDGIIPESDSRYTLILMASPNQSVEEKKMQLYDIYTSISKDAEIQSNSTITETKGTNTSSTLGFNKGTNFNANILIAGFTRNSGLNFSKTMGTSYSIGKSDGVTTTLTNYGIKHTMENIEQQIKRLEESAALGLWDFSAYVISNNPQLTKNVAYSYLSLTQGEESYLGKGCVNYWDYTKKEEVNTILKSLSILRHPVFVLNDKVDQDKDWLLYPMVVPATMPISGKELAYALNFPRKSVSGLPVFDSATFGREVQKYDLITESEKKVFIGKIVHMRKIESRNVELNLKSLTGHTFVTGSTGSGKTNVILQLLGKANKNNIKFLVIEPAKGEYKNAIGGLCKVYGTNPRLYELLKMNPFSFPEKISVLEHIDRLVEILNACWPMYAAMPAVLKDAIERSYRNKGWNLDSVYNVSKEFPTFYDILETLPEVLNESDYSADTKGDYVGALVTRIKSMTNGLNGRILCAQDEIDPKELFEENVIVDLSRVSSSETKALLMGILVMKLQEYKLNQEDNAFTDDLKHITVLEEAHNLLRRTVENQSSETANLQGKSVEMITNAIAEMRAYGEGFIIVDQAPGLLDDAVIRNTNTKIVLRLPDKNDRELVGKAAALSDTQIDEIAKLPKGVAVVYQNDWIEAVLCQFMAFTNKSQMKPYKYQEDIKNTINAANLFFAMLFPASEKTELTEEQVDAIKNWIEHLKYSDYTKRKLRNALVKGTVDDNALMEITYNLFEGRKFAQILLDAYDLEEGRLKAKYYVRSKYNLTEQCNLNLICDFLYQKVCIENKTGEIELRYGKMNGGRLW